jgi:hypothetical protein
VYSDTSFFADLGSALVEDYVRADFGESEEQDREEGGVEDNLADEDPWGKVSSWHKSRKRMIRID